MDNDKFEQIVHKFSKRIFNYLLKVLKNKEDAEDLLQDVFVSFYKKIDNVNETSYLSYLYQTDYHKAINKISSGKRNRTFIEKIKVETLIPQQGSDHDNFRSELIREAFRMIKPKEAFLLELQFYQKLSYQEIAEIMATTVSAVDSKLVRAKKKLKKIISQKLKDKSVMNYRGDNYEQEIRL